LRANGQKNRQATEELVKKRGLIILGIVVLVGAWLMVIGYEFLEKENALFQKKVKAAKEDQQRCVARLSKFRNFDQFRTSIRLPYTSDLPPERWMQQYGTLRAGMSESEVGIIMGAPDYARCDVSKEGDKFVGSVWQYEVAVPKDAANDSENSGMQVVFGPDGRLKDKFATNMQPKPSPTATPVTTATPESTATPVSSPTPSATPVASPQQAAPSGAATPSPTPQ
jgi:outer membrane protein assembly factor BamE (lipoprotein component of BamABCDE complex)